MLAPKELIPVSYLEFWCFISTLLLSSEFDAFEFNSRCWQLIFVSLQETSFNLL